MLKRKKMIEPTLSSLRATPTKNIANLLDREHPTAA
jgi:hypothetical protein